jgi:hypothetical protein
MSQENVELVRSVYADPSGLTAGASGKVAPDAEFDFTAIYPDRPIMRGVEEFRRFRDSGPWSGSPISFDPERFFDVDDERCSSSYECRPRARGAVHQSRSKSRTSSRSRRAGGALQGVREPRQGPRSRRAVGVGDFA